VRTPADVEAFETELARKHIALCKRCDGLGREARDLSKKCACQLEVDRLLAYYEACLPRRFWGTKVESFRGALNDTYQSRVRPFIVNFERALREGMGLYFYGDNGTGKTMTATYMARKVRARGFSVYYTTASDLLENMKRGFRDQVLNERLRELLESQLLVIDELGAEAFKVESSWALFQIERVLKARENECFPTVLVSNVPLVSAAEVYGKSVASVLRGYFVEVIFASEDGRGVADPAKLGIEE
jgi:DNA replication protein DnaC